MQLLIDENTIKCVWSSSGEFWFSRLDYTIHTSDDLGSDSDTQLIENGFLPFVTINGEELIRAYIASLKNKKLSSVFNKLSPQEIDDTFWKYYNAYKDISAGFEKFEKQFVLDKIIAWCDENDIAYKTEI